VATYQPTEYVCRWCHSIFVWGVNRPPKVCRDCRREQARWAALAKERLYNFAAVAHALNMTEERAAWKLRIKGSRMVTDGLDEVQADRIAIRAGFHPAEIWPEWLGVAMLVLDEEEAAA
jgi:capsid protein